MTRIREMLIDIAGLSAIKIGHEPRFGEDVYYRALTMRWKFFIPTLFLTYFAINIAFATLYMIQPGSVHGATPGVFSDHFFFSVETLATVGYGVKSPATFYGHVISSLEIFVGMFLTASITALTFARFATPRANLIFSSVATITRHESGYQALTIRVASRRRHLMADVTARVAIWRIIDTPDGHGRTRGLEDLKLQRDTTPVLGLFWPLVHIIDESSPLARCLVPDDIKKMDLRMIVSVSGTDEALAATVGSRKTYVCNDFKWAEFSPVVDEMPDGTPRVDLSRLSELRDAA